MNPVIGGTYRHYKRGGTYEVLAIARHTETDEEMVVYKALYGDEHFPIGKVWVRPLAMFLEVVDDAGEMKPRFSLLK